jgi:hypothetical protein
MDEPARAGIVAYVRAATALQGLPLSAERERAVVDVVERLALFATDVAGLKLADDAEPAGTFQP